jgi:hypothetical protein
MQDQIEDAKQIEMINDDFFDAVEKLVKGDYSITPEQKEDIQEILVDTFGPAKEELAAAGEEIEAGIEKGIGEAEAELKAGFEEAEAALDAAFEQISDQLTRDFSTAKDDVRTAIDRLNDAMTTEISETLGIAKLDAEKAFDDLESQARQTAERLGRSYSDVDFQRDIADIESGTLERLNREAMARLQIGTTQLGATAAMTTANLSTEEARLRAQLGQTGALASADLARTGTLSAADLARTGVLSTAESRIRQQQLLASLLGQETAAGLGLRTSAAQPIAAYGAGGGFSELQSALEAQGLQNRLATISPIFQWAGNLKQERFAQPTQTTSTSPGFWDIFGGIADIGLGIGGLFKPG